MDKNIELFLEELAESLELEKKDLNIDTKFENIAWDSLAIISSIALIDEYFNKTISAAQISSCETIGDLINLAKSN